MVQLGESGTEAARAFVVRAACGLQDFSPQLHSQAGVVVVVKTHWLSIGQGVLRRACGTVCYRHFAPTYHEGPLGVHLPAQGHSRAEPLH